MTWALEAGSFSGDAARIATFALGLVLLILTTTSIVRTMVIPRATASLIYAVILRATDATFNGLARLRRDYASRDRVLAWSGAVGIITALFVWLVLFLTAYALMIYGVSGGSAAQSIQQAGSGLFTLGLIGTPSGTESIVDFLAAMTGPAVIALLIGFLPTLYQAYLGRESRVLLNSGFSGAPAWGPELLVRVQLLEGDAELPTIYDDWVEWSAQVRLTQTLYPSLSRFRSPVGTRHWLIAIIAVLDSAALQVSLSTGSPDPRTVAVLEQGAQALLSIDATEVDLDRVVRFSGVERRMKAALEVFGVRSRQGQPTSDDFRSSQFFSPGLRAVSRAVTLDNLQGRVPETREFLLDYEGMQSRLPREDFDHALDYMRASGVSIDREPDAAYEMFRTLRGRYEAAAYHLAERFYAPPAPWTGPRRPATETIWPALAGEQLES